VGTGAYGKVPGTLTWDSGSLAPLRSRNTPSPWSAPSFCRRASRKAERRASSPPSFPNFAPIRAPTAMLSRRVHGLAELPDLALKALMPAA
jgi:hypothetical protein